jgi:GTP-binding protein Era
MNRVAGNTLGYVDVAILLLEALRWTDEDHDVLKRLQTFSGPVIAAVNKVDRVKDKAELLPFLKELNGKHNFLDIVPLSALRNDNVDVLEKLVAEHLPPSNFLFSEDQITTASQRFLAGELIREKLTRLLRDELPYALTVEIENFSETGNLIRIGAVIWVERAGQKGIVIGSGGEVLKKAGQQARADMEKIFDRKIFLETWVKVRSGWSDDERALHQFGYREES